MRIHFSWQQKSYSCGHKIKYLYDNLLISCHNKYIKIWNENFNNITLRTKLNLESIYTFLVLKDKNKLFIAKKNVEIRNLKNLKLEKSFNDIIPNNYVVLKRLDRDKIIVANLSSSVDYFLLLISVSQEKIIDKISTNGRWNILYPLKNKNILLVSNNGCEEALVVKKDDFYIDYKFNPIKFYDTIIKGFIELDNNKFAIFGSEGTIKIFKIS